MKQFVLKITTFLCCLNISYAQSIETPSSLPEVKYHLTAMPWQALNISKDDYLDRVEGIARQIAKFQSSTGQIIDPYANYEIQYATPYFANAVGTLISQGRALDLLDEGIAAMNNSTDDIAHGSSWIPQDHGEFFVAPLSNAISLYASHVSTAQLNIWKKRVSKQPISNILRGTLQNWRTYAMKGEWSRAKNGYVNKKTAVNWLENSWTNTQKKRLTNNVFNFYHDNTSDPDSWPYESIARSNLLNMIADGYDGASRDEILNILEKGTQFSLLFQDPTGQGVAGGRSGNHTWNDILAANGYETMAEMALKKGDIRLAGQYRRAAALAFRSVQRWRRSDGTYSVTKNHFDPQDRVKYAPYSFLTNYNGNLMFHMSENYLRHKSNIPEQPAPNEIGGYTIVSDPDLATAVANAGGMHMEVSLRGSTSINHNQYWTTLGAVRFAKPGWDSRLGPSDGVRETANNLGVSFAPTFWENGKWVRLASVPDRYEATFSTQFTHPLLVRCKVVYKPKSGKTGPSFTNFFIITPDGILSTVTTARSYYGVTWPVLTFDGATRLNTNFTSHIASISFPGKTDQQNFIALHASPTIIADEDVSRSSYGDLRPVRMISGSAMNETFIYPRTAEDPLAEDVRKSYTRSGDNFSTVLGTIKGDMYVGRTSAGGVGTSLDIDNDGNNDVTFNSTTGFIMQLENGKITKIETDRDVRAVVKGQTLDLNAYTPVSISNTIKQSVDKVIASTDDGNVPENTLDKDYNTRWSGKGNNQWIKYNLGETTTITSVKIAWYRGDKRKASFDIQTSVDGTEWITVFSGTSSGQTTSLETYNISSVAPARFVRIVGHSNTENTWNSITEVEIFKDTKNQEASKNKLRTQPIQLNLKPDEITDLRVSPNPNRGIFTVQTSSEWLNSRLIIYDISGKIILNKNVNQSVNQINLSTAAKGAYILKLSKNDKVLNKKIVLQ